MGFVPTSSLPRQWNSYSAFRYICDVIWKVILASLVRGGGNEIRWLFHSLLWFRLVGKSLRLKYIFAWWTHWAGHTNYFIMILILGKSYDRQNCDLVVEWSAFGTCWQQLGIGLIAKKHRVLMNSRKNLIHDLRNIREQTSISNVTLWLWCSRCRTW